MTPIVPMSKFSPLALQKYFIEIECLSLSNQAVSLYLQSIQSDKSKLILVLTGSELLT
jgi:hypothetical protein